ncbi:hypothetical protein JCM10213_007491 [Rhodosporidiobolus nylandii]
MFGGSTSAGGRWSLGAKTYRAPTEGERIREQNDRLARERERRKLESSRSSSMSRSISGRRRSCRGRATQGSRVNARALGMELGSRSPGLLGVGGLAGRSPRLRSSSISGVGACSPRMFSLGSPAIGGVGSMPGGLGLGGNGGGGEARRREADLARVRAQRHQLEAEAARRERTASAMRRERAELAIANERILSSPRLSPAVHGIGIHGLGVPGAGLRGTRSWSGNLPHMHLALSPRLGPAASPRLVPVPVPIPVHSHGHSHSPHISVLPRLMPIGGRGRTPSPGRLAGGLGFSPHLGGHSPRVINYNTYNVSQHMRPVGVGGGGLGGLGGLDDLGGGMHHHHHGGLPMIDPLVLDGGIPGGGLRAVGMAGALGSGIGVLHSHNFVVTDLDYEPGRSILQDYGFIEGVSGGGQFLGEDEKLSLAIATLTNNAQAMGANAVLQVETGEDMGGQIVVRGRAVVLS